MKSIIIIVFVILNSTNSLNSGLDCDNDSGKNDVCFYDQGSTTITAHVNGTVLLPCLVRNVGTLFITWWKLGQNSPISLNHKVKKQPEKFLLEKKNQNNFTLKITNLKIQDSGRYACQINDRPIKEKIFNLIVERESFRKDTNDKTYTFLPPKSNKRVQTLLPESIEDDQIVVDGARKTLKGSALVLNCSLTYSEHIRKDKTPVWCKVDKDTTKPLTGHFFVGGSIKSNARDYRMNRNDQFDIAMRWLDNVYRSVLSLREIDFEHSGIYVCSLACNKPWTRENFKTHKNWIKVEIISPSNYDSKLSADDPMQKDLTNNIGAKNFRKFQKAPVSLTNTLINHYEISRIYYTLYVLILLLFN